MPQQNPIAIYHEHQDWFRPLFAELDRRELPYVRLDARSHRYDPRANPDYALVLNRMSPSAFKRGAGHAIFYTLQYLSYLELQGVRVINGRQAYAVEISKALQLSLLEQLGLPYPRAIVINSAEQAVPAAEHLRFPIVIKPNIGGSGAGIIRFDTADALAAAVRNGSLTLGLDNTALVQEFVPARDGHIVRVEVLGGKYLYAIKVHLTGDTFNLCPADICQTADGRELVRGACPAEAPKSGLRVEGYTPPAEVIRNVELITAAAGIEVGGVEYIVDDRDGSLAYYDINALSNFVADAERVVGFDPHVRLVDYLETQAQAATAVAAD